MSDQPAGSNRPVWESEEKYPKECAVLRDALREVTDPEIGLNIIQLGLIRNVIYSPEQVILKMILTTPFCPYGPAMMEMTRSKAEEAMKIPVRIDLGMDAWDFSMMEEGLDMDWGLY